MKKTISIAVLTCSFFLVSNFAQADLPGFYAGGQIGGSDTHNSASNVKVKSTGIAENVYAGYQFNENLGVEAGYTNFAKAKYDLRNSLEASENSIDLAGKAVMPLEYNLNLYGKLGTAYVKSKELNGDALKSINSYMALAAAGVSYNINDNLPVNLSWNRYQKVKGKVRSADFVAIGAQWNFG